MKICLLPLEAQIKARGRGRKPVGTTPSLMFRAVVGLDGESEISMAGL